MGRAIQQLSKIVRLHEQEFKLACSGMLGDFMLWLSLQKSVFRRNLERSQTISRRFAKRNVNPIFLVFLAISSLMRIETIIILVVITPLDRFINVWTGYY